MIYRILYYIFYCAAVSPISTMNYFFAKNNKFSKTVLAKNLTEPQTTKCHNDEKAGGKPQAIKFYWGNAAWFCKVWVTICSPTCIMT